MAKKYFKKKSKIKKGSDLPPGMRRMKGLGRDVIPRFMYHASTTTDVDDIASQEELAAGAAKLVAICNRVVEDPSVMVMRALHDDDLDRKLDELIPDEDD